MSIKIYLDNFLKKNIYTKINNSNFRSGVGHLLQVIFGFEFQNAVAVVDAFGAFRRHVELDCDARVEEQAGEEVLEDASVNVQLLPGLESNPGQRGHVQKVEEAADRPAAADDQLAEEEKDHEAEARRRGHDVQPQSGLFAAEPVRCLGDGPGCQDDVLQELNEEVEGSLRFGLQDLERFCPEGVEQPDGECWRVRVQVPGSHLDGSPDGDA